MAVSDQRGGDLRGSGQPAPARFPGSSEPQRDDAGQDDQRGDGALRLERLAEQRNADQRGEHDRGLAQGGDRGDRGLGIAQITTA